MGAPAPYATYPNNPYTYINARPTPSAGRFTPLFSDRTAQGLYDLSGTSLNFGMSNAQWADNAANMVQHYYDAPQNWLNNEYSNNMFGTNGLYSQMGKPSQSQGALDAYIREMNFGQPQMEKLFDQYSGNLGTPGATENYYAQNQAAYGAPGAAENFYAQNQGFYTSPTAASDVYNRYGSQLAGPGRLENLNLAGSNRLQSFADQLKGAQGVNQLNALSPEIAAGIRSSDDVRNYYMSQLPSLSGPGIYEQFVTSDITGTNPLLAQAKEEGLASINQEMARRGAFDSGAAAGSIGKFLGNIAAQDYQNRAERARTAQGMELARIGEGGQLAGASGASSLARAGALQNLGQGQESTNLARLSQQLQGQQAASGELMANNQMLMDLAGRQDQATLNRLQGLQNMAGMADTNTLARYAAGQNAAQGAQQLNLNRLAGGLNAAQGADQGEMQRIAQLFGMGKDMDAYKQNEFNLLGQLAGRSDEEKRALMQMQVDANQNMFANQMMLGQGRVATQLPYANMHYEAQMQAQSDYLNLMADAYEAQGNYDAAKAARNAAKSGGRWGLGGAILGGGIGLFASGGNPMAGIAGAKAGYEIGNEYGRSR